MDEALNASDSSHTRNNDSQWQFLGELELLAGTNLDETLRAWLTKLLEPLALHPDFVHRILMSALDAAARAFQGEAEMMCDHLHLVIYGPVGQGSIPGTWGFFRVEKVENTSKEGSNAMHSIEFYLYMEGQS